MPQMERKIFLAVFGFLALFLWLQSHEIDKLKNEKRAQEIASLEATAKTREEFNEKLTSITNDLSKQLRVASDLSSARGADIERLRSENRSLQRRLARASKGSDGDALAKCSNLLAEGAELLGKGEGLLLRNATKHDALVKFSEKANH